MNNGGEAADQMVREALQFSYSFLFCRCLVSCEKGSGFGLLKRRSQPGFFSQTLGFVFFNRLLVA